MNKEDTKVAGIFIEDINNLIEHLNIVINAHNKQLDKIDQLTNNWNELEKWLKEQKEDANKCIEWNKNKNQYYDKYKRDIARFDFILDKMKEIKEQNNE